jgi:hypothetical protein
MHGPQSLTATGTLPAIPAGSLVLKDQPECSAGRVAKYDHTRCRYRRCIVSRRSPPSAPRSPPCAVLRSSGIAPGLCTRTRRPDHALPVRTSGTARGQNHEQSRRIRGSCETRSRRTSEDVPNPPPTWHPGARNIGGRDGRACCGSRRAVGAHLNLDRRRRARGTSRAPKARITPRARAPGAYAGHHPTRGVPRVGRPSRR